MPMNLIRQFGWVFGLFIAGSGLASSYYLRTKDSATAESLIAQGASLVADYGSFQILASDTLPKDLSGWSIEKGASRIDLKAGVLDTRNPAARALRKSIGPFAGKRLHLIQFAGPIEPGWVSALEGCGVQVLNYLPRNAYLVYGNASALQRLRDWAQSANMVQWDGDYPADRRIHPRARAIAGQTGLQDAGQDTFVVQLVSDPDENPATLAVIRQMSLAPVQSEFGVLHFLNVIVRLPRARLADLSARPDVVFIEPYAEPQKLDESQDQIVAGNLSSNTPSGPGYLAWLADKGFSQTQFDASGFVVDVSDSGVGNGTNAPGHFGLYALGDPALSNRLVYQRLEGTPHPGSTLAGCDGHGALNAHIIAGYSAFQGFPFTDPLGYAYGLGVCPFVRIGSSVVFDPNIFTSPSFPDLQSEAYFDGARISTCSWGNSSSGGYDILSQTFDALARDAQPDGSLYGTNGNQEMVLVAAAGNGESAGTIESPGTAKNVITVGAAENVRSLSPANGGRDPAGNDGCSEDDSAADSANDVASYSSRGPCADGRMKPDLVAPGTHVTGGIPQNAPALTNGIGSALDCFDAAGITALPGGGTCHYPFMTGNSNNFFPLNQQFYSVSSGTSFAAPAVAGGCALLRQYFINNGLPAPSPAMTKAYLINSARYLDGAGANDTLWSPAQGMGELNLGRAFDGAPRILRDQMPGDTFTNTGQTRTFTGTITNSSLPFRVTLAWTDAPGSPSAGQELVNDLDLTVTIGGVTYKGNVFNGAYSVAGGAADSLNNVESVFLPAGVTGNFVVTVTAANITGDGVPNEGPSLDQDFALVIYNAVQTFVPIVVLDSARILAENCGTGNNAVDPGETVTVAFALKNVGTSDATNLTVTLLQTNGVALPSPAQTYGALLAGDLALTQAFSFTAGGLCGTSISPVLRLQDGPRSLGSVIGSFPLGAPTTFTNTDANTNTIVIPGQGDTGPAAPYSSDIALTGITGTVTKVTVTLSGLSHSNPLYLDVLLAGPGVTNAPGTNVMLMSYCSGLEVSNATLVFDDDAAAMLPQYGLITNGTYQPSGYFADGEILTSPAPTAPFGQTLSVFNGLDPNGIWSLYVQQNSSGDTGSIAQGWQLSVTTSNLTCCSGAILPAPRIESFSRSNCVNTVTWSAVPYARYRLQYATNLGETDWSNVLPDVLATNFTASMNSQSNSRSRTFFRVKVVSP
jgi:Subtilase family